MLEGIDGAGTSTQASLLVDALARAGLPSHLTGEPSGGPVGMLIRQILAGRLVIVGRTGTRSPGMETMALLFAADRTDHLEAEMVPNLQDGITVVCDRYIHSSIAYQTLTAAGDRDKALSWVTQINSRARIPDLVLLLDVEPKQAARRRKLRGECEQIYDTEILQSNLAGFYRCLPHSFPDHPIIVVDANRDIESVHADCLRATLKILQGETS